MRAHERCTSWTAIERSELNPGRADVMQQPKQVQRTGLKVLHAGKLRQTHGDVVRGTNGRAEDWETRSISVRRGHGDDATRARDYEGRKDRRFVRRTVRWLKKRSLDRISFGRMGRSLLL